MNTEKIKKINDELVETAKSIKVLTALSWPSGPGEKFLKDWKKGNPTLPTINLQKRELSEELSGLQKIMKQLNQDEPIEKYLYETAFSYAAACQMLANIGTKEFTRHSISIYGRPDMSYDTQKSNGVDAAKFLLNVTDQLNQHDDISNVDYTMASSDFANWIESKVNKFFTDDKVEIVVDSSISAKALAGATKIKIRESAMFSELDKKQLLNHEAFIHSATQLNGMKQGNLTSLGLGAPRTTRTQEGLAMLAELLTLSIDISRLRRVALRVIATKMALDGADFIEVFRYFLGSGQSEAESVLSAQRIFRGGAVKDGIVFTKDSVYLIGLFEVHTFLRMAIRENRPDLIINLFSGRMTIADSLRLAPYFENGWLNTAHYIPEWASDMRKLAAYMSFSAFISNINLDKITTDNFYILEDRLKKM